MAQPLVGGVLGAGFGDLRGIAAALEETALQLAESVEGAEELAARLPPTPGVADALNKLKLRAERVGIAHAYFQEMAEHRETPVVFDRAVYGVGELLSELTRAPVTKP